jgi:molybdate transport system substrate-binding protein
MMRRLLPAAVVGLCALFVPLASASAAEIKVLCSNGLREVFAELRPEFERASGHKIAVTYGLAAAFKQQIEAGEAFDVVVVTPPLLDDMVKQGKVAGDGRATIARAGIGIAIRAGAARPDISNTEAFKHTLAAAKSVTYAKAGQSGVYFAGLLTRLGIADQVKTRPEPTGVEVGAAVAQGEAELGVLPISEIMPVKGVEVLGPLPAELQSYVVMAAGVGTGAKEGAAAVELVKFLKSPDHLPVIKAKGMEPG